MKNQNILPSNSKDKKNTQTLYEDVYILYFDGAVEPKNPGGHMGCGYWVEYNGENILNGSYYIPAASENTNNIAEYMALIYGLEALQKLSPKIVEVRGDSQLVIKQMKCEWGANKGGYIPYYEKAISILIDMVKIGHVFFEWIPREENHIADSYSVQTLIENGITRKKR